MSGVVVGGWEYVWAAYGITTVALIVYAISLINRIRGARVSPSGSNHD